MMKILILFFMFILIVSDVSAQNDDFNKFEVGANYSFERIDKSGGFNDKSWSNGFEVSVTGNFSRYFGVKFDVSGAYKTKDFSVTAIAPPNSRRFTVKSTVYNYLGGIQIKDNSPEKKVKPFAHFLVGAGTIRQRLTGQCPNDVQSICSSYNFSETGFSMGFGGGIDLKMSDRVSVRAIQTDYNLIRFKGGSSNNFRLGVGLVFH